MPVLEETAILLRRDEFYRNKSKKRKASCVDYEQCGSRNDYAVALDRLKAIKRVDNLNTKKNVKLCQWQATQRDGSNSTTKKERKKKEKEKKKQQQQQQNCRTSNDHLW